MNKKIFFTYLPLIFYFLYIAILLGVRLILWDGILFSDAVEMVDKVYFAFNYNMSHPPLMNWIYRIVVELTNWDWLAADILLRVFVYGCVAFLMWEAACRVSGPLAGVCVLACLATLRVASFILFVQGTHSLGVLLGTAIVIHALALLNDNPTKFRFVWMGFGLAVGLLSKYNYAIFAPCLLFSIWLLKPYSDQTGRVVYALAVAVVLAAPIYLFQLLEFPETTTARLSRLGESGSGAFRGAEGMLYMAKKLGKVVIPYIAPFVALLVFCGPRHIGRTLFFHPLASVILLTLILFTLSFAGLVIILDAQVVHEHYLLPGILIGVYLLSIMVCAHRRAAIAFVALIFCAIPFDLTAHWKYHQNVSTARTMYTIDYEPIASEIRDQIDGPPRLIGAHHVAGYVRAVLSPRISVQHTDGQTATPVYIWLEALPDEPTINNVNIANYTQTFLGEKLPENKICRLAHDLLLGVPRAFICYKVEI